MGKLIFADTFDNFTSKFEDWNNHLDPSYYSIVFTADGYVVTHGKQFGLNVIGEVDPVGIRLTNGKTVELYGNDLTGSSFDLPVYKILASDKNPINVLGAGEITIEHALASTDTTGLTSYGKLTNDFKLNIPKFYVDAYGHVLNVDTIETPVNLVKQNLITNTKFYLLGTVAEDSTEAGSTVFDTDVFIDNNALHAESFYEGGTSLGFKYVKSAWVGDGKGQNQASYYGTGSAEGIVRLSDAYDSDTLDTSKHTAATPKAVKQGVDQAIAKAKELFSSNDAMIFMGTVEYDGTIRTHNSTVASANGVTITNGTTKIKDITAYIGWTFKFISKGTFTFKGQTWEVEIGNMLVCTNEGANPEYDIIQTNIENQVIGEETTFSKGIVIATGNGRIVTVFPYSNASKGQALIYSGNDTVSWSDVANTWRPINLNGAEVLSNLTGTNALNFKNSTGITITNQDGTLTFTNSSPLSSASGFTINNASELVATYNPKNATNPTLNFGGNIIEAVLNDQIITVEHKKILNSTKTENLYKLAIDAYGHITKATAHTFNKLNIKSGTSSIDFNTTNDVYLEFTNGTDITWNSQVSNGKITLTPSVTHKYKTLNFYNNNVSTAELTSSGSSLNIKAGDNVIFTKDGTDLLISSVNTWRSVQAYHLSNLNNSIAGDDFQTVLSSSISTNALKFGNEFTWDGDEIKLVWTEIDGDTITYSV